MKNPFFKKMLKAIFVACIAIAVCNCGEDSASASGSDNGGATSAIAEDTWHYNANGIDVYITADGRALDANGNLVAYFANGILATSEGTTIAQGIDINTLPFVPASSSSTAQPRVLNVAGQDYIIYPPVEGVYDAEGHALGVVTTADGTQTGVFVYLTETSGTVADMNLSAVLENVDLSERPIYQGNTNPTPVSSSALVIPTPTQSSAIETPVSSSSQQAKSSSSQQAKSSSSQKQSSSSQQAKSSSSQQANAPQLPKIIDNTVKSGYATRYWDSCKPHCAWKGKGGPVARTCSTDGMTTASADDNSVCDGGNAGTCFDQTPQIINDTIAYAFAATPGGGNDCGKCYMLTFKGTGASATNTPTDSHHQAIKGKHLIVMSSNIGYDVNHNQFDLMIPGGGPGAYNGCGKMGISCAGSQYGGFLTTCNYKKDCLIKMCNDEYKNESLRNGCLFLANWMDAANNPEVDFVQVECPKELEAKY